MPLLTPHQQFERKWRGFFEEFARGHEDDAGISGWSERGLAARLRNFRRLWSAPPGQQWLDAGCGAGNYARLLSESGQNVLALDYSLPTLVKARDRGSEGVQWCLADVRALPVRPRSFDGALCFGVLQALSAPEPAIAELAAALRPGARLWIDALNRHFLPSLADTIRRRVRGKRMHLRYDDPYALRRALQQAGFREVRIHWVPIAPGAIHRLQPLLESGPVRLLLRWCPPLATVCSHAFVVSGRR